MEQKIQPLTEDQIRQAKSRFLSNMSHEIRTPMNAVLGFTELLLGEEQDPHKLLTIQAMRQSALHLMGVINEIFHYSSLEDGTATIVRTRFPLKQLFKSVMANHLIEANDKHLDMRLSIDPELPGEVIGDQIKLTQIIGNLVNNAVKFTENGGIMVEARSIFKKAGAFELSVKVIDTGIGIPENKHEDIFHAFTQAEDDNKRVYGGTGMGLAIVSQLLELLGGRMSMESTPSKGSTFTVIIPLGIPEDVKPIHQSGGPASGIRPNALAGLRILVVEDNRVNQMVAVQLLRRFEAEVDLAVNGDEGVNMIREISYDIILMDLHMPVMNGFEAALQIKEFSSVPIVALTADVFPQTREKALYCGMADVVTKPFAIQDLLAVILHLTGKQ